MAFAVLPDALNDLLSKLHVRLNVLPFFTKRDGREPNAIAKLVILEV